MRGGGGGMWRSISMILMVAIIEGFSLIQCKLVAASI